MGFISAVHVLERVKLHVIPVMEKGKQNYLAKQSLVDLRSIEKQKVPLTIYS